MLGYKTVKKYVVNTGMKDKETILITTWAILLLFWGFIFIRLIMGLDGSNKRNECVAKSIGDLITAPIYSIGCQIGKERFLIKLN